MLELWWGLVGCEMAQTATRQLAHHAKPIAAKCMQQINSLQTTDQTLQCRSKCNCTACKAVTGTGMAKCSKCPALLYRFGTSSHAALSSGLIMELTVAAAYLYGDLVTLSSGRCNCSRALCNRFIFTHELCIRA